MSYYSTSNNNISIGDNPMSQYGTITGRKNNIKTNGSIVSGTSTINKPRAGRKNSMATTATTNFTLTSMSPEEK